MRKTLTLLFAATTLTFGANLALAADRDIGPDEALKLRDAGTIQSFESLNETALKQHPGARWKKPSSRKRMAATSTRWSCAMPRISNGT